MQNFSSKVFNVSALALACTVGALITAIIPGSDRYAVAAEPFSDVVALANDHDDDTRAIVAEHTPSSILAATSDVASERPADDLPAWREIASAVPGMADAPQTQALNAPTSGSAENPFANTCDGRAIGFVTATGERPRMEFSGVPAGAILECRTARAADVAKTPFTRCDGDTGSKPVHQPTFTAEGRHRTEVRYRLEGSVSPTLQASYYVHRSLDRVACCQASVPDSAWFAAALTSIKPADVFDTATRIDNPVVTIAARTRSGKHAQTILSLRRTFRLSPDRRLLLIRRTMASRRTFERTKTNSCVGLQIAVPTYAPNPPACRPGNESPYNGARLPSKCPGIYCTVTTCRATSPACVQVTYTFNRGPGQTPWVKRMPEQCAPDRVASLKPTQCDAYVLSSSGEAVCLVNQGGQIRAAATISGTQPALGLTLLAQRRGVASAPDHYVFSAKSTRKAGIKNVLYLPQ